MEQIEYQIKPASISIIGEHNHTVRAFKMLGLNSQY